MKSEMIRLLPVYQGVDSKNPYSFMRDFENVCSAFLSTGSPLHIICMVLFPFSLKEKAKIWFHSLAPNSIFTWEDMRNEFLNKLFPPAFTNALMRAIQNFQNQVFLNQAPPFQNQGPQGFPVSPNQGLHPLSQGNSNPLPDQPPHKRSLEDIVTQFVQAQQSTNTEFRTTLNDVRSQITKMTSSMGNFQKEKGKLPSQTIQNPQGQNSVGVSGPSDGTFEHCKAVTTLQSGK